MANPFLLFENVFEDGTLGGTTPATGFPASNALDWRIGTPYRWKSGTTATVIYYTVDLGVGNTAAPDTLAIGGHNLFSADAKIRVEASTDDITYNEDATDYHTPTDNYPLYIKLTSGYDRRYWRIAIHEAANGANTAAAPQIGVITLGRRMEFPHGPEEGFDAYGFDPREENNVSERGGFLGTNIKSVVKSFGIQYQSVGLSRTSFYAPSSGLTFDGDFRDHIGYKGNKRPFWYAPEVDSGAEGIWLCHAQGGPRMPFKSNTTRRDLYLPVVGRREVS